MKARYSIWGRMHGADHDAELAQVETNPEALARAYAEKMLTIRHSILSSNKKQSKVRQYSGLRIVENVRR
jgi:hypothetical protein